MTVLSAYPYLFMSLVLLALSVACFLAAGGQRRAMAASALLSAPCGFLSILYVPAYWSPVRVAEFGAGFEDLAFSFANGAIVWLMVTLPVRKQLSVRIVGARLLRRYLLCMLPGICFGVILISAGVKVMHSTLVGMAALGIVLLWMRRELWPLAVAGAAGFGVCYTILCHLIFGLNPQFLAQWNPAALTGVSLLGVPLEEIAWSIGFGFTWPLIVAYALDARLGRAEHAEEAGARFPSDTRTAWSQELEGQEDEW